MHGENEYLNVRRAFRVHGYPCVAFFLWFDIHFMEIRINVHLSEGELLGRRVVVGVQSKAAPLMLCYEIMGLMGGRTGSVGCAKGK